MGHRFFIGKNLGVAGFFIISGFLYFKSVKKLNDISLHKTELFIYKKIKRLYIPFAIAITFLCISNIFITYMNSPKWIDFFSNLILLRTIIKVPIVDGAHWYFYAMIQLNLIIPTLILAYKKKSIVYSIVGLALIAYFVGMHIIAINKTFLLCFISGGCLAMENKKIGLTLYIICSMIILSKLGTFLCLLIFVMLPCIIYTIPQIHIVTKLLFENKIMVFLGTYSYMWYLIHQQLGYSIIHILKGMINDYLNVVIAMSITFLISICLHHATNQFMNMLQKNK